MFLDQKNREGKRDGAWEDDSLFQHRSHLVFDFLLLEVRITV